MLNLDVSGFFWKMIQILDALFYVFLFVAIISAMIYLSGMME